jgi:hypothetical protein
MAFCCNDKLNIHLKLRLSLFEVARNHNKLKDSCAGGWQDASGTTQGYHYHIIKRGRKDELISSSGSRKD